MPTYDYVCDKCGLRYEKFQNMSAEPDTKCPECGGKVRRLIGAGAGLIFKGSGFYQTDYKTPSRPSDSSAPPTCPVAKD
ncbi:MAG: zinc ribbon domain-containing protein [Candidatus Sabulitectum sp.]|nr:zinc ribbon domain-containing protein [Candidatus Sabulitectum sp.]